HDFGDDVAFVHSDHDVIDRQDRSVTVRSTLTSSAVHTVGVGVGSDSVQSQRDENAKYPTTRRHLTNTAARDGRDDEVIAECPIIKFTSCMPPNGRSRLPGAAR